MDTSQGLAESGSNTVRQNGPNVVVLEHPNGSKVGSLAPRV